MSGMNSRTLAAVAVVVNLTVCALAAVVVLVVRDHDAAPVAAPAATSSVLSTSARPSTLVTTSATTPATTSAPAVPGGTQPVSGPAGITTAIPAGWQVKPTSAPGSVQATDPAQPARFLRYGGSPSPGKALLAAQQDYERTFPRGHAGYRLIGLEPTTVRGAEAVAWEFEFQADVGLKHVKSVYWRAQGVDYFVYGSSVVAGWTDMQVIFDAALSAAKP
jgi:hypothetical protein